MNFSSNINVPIIAAFLIGILGSTAPCQITTNLGAVGFISKKGTTKTKLLQNIFWYSLGKIIVFLFYGVLIYLFNINISKLSIPLFSFVRKFIGLSVIIIGLYILGAINLKGSIGSFIIINAEKYSNKLKIFNTTLVMGILFSLAFCPTLFWLFFGIVVPLSLKSSIGFIYPVIFAIGTLIPMLCLIFILFLGKDNLNINIKSLRKGEKTFKICGGLLLIIFGLIDTLIYWLT